MGGTNLVAPADPQTKDQLVSRVQEARRQVHFRRRELDKAKVKREEFEKDLKTYTQKLKSEGIEPKDLDGLIEQKERELVRRLEKLEGELNVISKT